MPWIDLDDDVKPHLNKSATVTTDDDELEGFITAACSIIEDLKGHVDMTDVTEVQRAAWISGNRHRRDYAYPGRRRYLIDLYETPVASITSVGRYDGVGVLTTVDAEDPTTGALGWVLADGALYVPTAGEYTVTYTAGRDPVPGNFRLAALELVAHLWRGSQLNQSSGRPQVPGDQMMTLPQVVSAMPFRVRELLGIYGPVVNDHVVIA